MFLASKVMGFSAQTYRTSEGVETTFRKCSAGNGTEDDKKRQAIALTSTASLPRRPGGQKEDQGAKRHHASPHNTHHAAAYTICHAAVPK